MVEVVRVGKPRAVRFVAPLGLEPCMRRLSGPALSCAGMPKVASFARLDAFTRGQIVGLRQEGATGQSIAKRVKKRA